MSTVEGLLIIHILTIDHVEFRVFVLGGVRPCDFGSRAEGLGFCLGI